MFDQAKADAICARLADGESLRKAAKAEGVGTQTVLDWSEANANFAGQYARARSIGYALLAEELLEISDDGANDSYESDDGSVRINSEVVARSRLRVDTRKWLLSKMLPKVYGDKLDLNHSGEVGVRQIERRIVDTVSPDDTNKV